MTKWIGFFGFALVALLLPLRTLEARPIMMTVVMVPDNQYYSDASQGGTSAMNLAQVNYASSIRANAIVYVGDNFNDTHNATDRSNISQWVSALNGTGIPWISPPGNHDYDSVLGGYVGDARIATTWDKYVGSPMATQTAFKGSFPAGSQVNSWVDLGTHSRVHWGVISLEFCPTNEALDWADGVINANPQFKFIVTTHNYLTDAGTLDDTSPEASHASCPKDGLRNDYNNGQGIWDRLIRDHDDQVRLVLSGHWNPRWSYAAHKTGTGSHGFVVNEVYFDPQSTRRGGNGYLRVMTFYVNNTVTVETFSPVTSRFLTDSQNQFTMDLSGPGQL